MCRLLSRKSQRRSRRRNATGDIDFHSAAKCHWRCCSIACTSCFSCSCLLLVLSFLIYPSPSMTRLSHTNAGQAERNASREDVGHCHPAGQQLSEHNGSCQCHDFCDGDGDGDVRLRHKMARFYTRYQARRAMGSPELPNREVRVGRAHNARGGVKRKIRPKVAEREREAVERERESCYGKGLTVTRDNPWRKENESTYPRGTQRRQTRVDRAALAADLAARPCTPATLDIREQGNEHLYLHCHVCSHVTAYLEPTIQRAE